MKKAGINLIEVKERNRALLLQSVCTAGSITRSELSEGLHLSPMTVTNITSELLQKHIIEEFAPQDPIKSPAHTDAAAHLLHVAGGAGHLHLPHVSVRRGVRSVASASGARQAPAHPD